MKHEKYKVLFKIDKTMQETKSPAPHIKTPTFWAKLFALMTIGALSGCEAILCSTMVNCFDPLGRAPYSPNIVYLQLKTPNHMDAYIHWLEKDFGGSGEVSTDAIIQTHMPDKLANGWPPPDPLQEIPSFPRFNGLSKIPGKIIIEWTSLPESKTYRTIIPLHLDIHRKIKSEVETSCMRNESPVRSKRNIITLELAPGGKIKGWLSGFCLDSIEVIMKQGMPITKKERAKHSNRALINYSPAPMDKYIKAHSIPYGSW